jgi:imidazoleglycerol-phosphate dehydratase
LESSERLNVIEACLLGLHSREAQQQFLNATTTTTTALHKMGDAEPEVRVRSAALSRDTNETKIQLAINLDGGAFPAETDKRLTNGTDGHASQASKSQTIVINSGIGFLDHMLHALAKHAGWSLALNCKGDLHSQ